MINTNRDRARITAENWPEPVREISPAMRIRGLHHVTAIGTSIEGTAAFIAGRLGMRRVKRTNNFDDVNSFHWYWGVGGGPPGTLVTYFDRKPERERPVAMGAGRSPTTPSPPGPMPSSRWAPPSAVRDCRLLRSSSSALMRPGSGRWPRGTPTAIRCW